MWEKENLSIKSFPFFSSILLTSAGQVIFFFLRRGTSLFFLSFWESRKSFWPFFSREFCKVAPTKKLGTGIETKPSKFSSAPNSFFLGQEKGGDRKLSKFEGGNKEKGGPGCNSRLGNNPLPFPFPFPLVRFRQSYCCCGQKWSLLFPKSGNRTKIILGRMKKKRPVVITGFGRKGAD